MFFGSFVYSATTSPSVSVVRQKYDVVVKDAYVRVGNTGVLRCEIPPNVKKHVRVTSWVQDSTFNIFPAPESGECTNFICSKDSRVHFSSKKLKKRWTTLHFLILTSGTWKLIRKISQRQFWRRDIWKLGKSSPISIFELLFYNYLRQRWILRLSTVSVYIY